MKKIIWFYCLLCALSCWPGCRLTAQTFPAVSDGTTENWYYIVFNSADDIVAAKGEGEIAVVAIPTGRDAQLWKVRWLVMRVTLQGERWVLLLRGGRSRALQAR